MRRAVDNVRGGCEDGQGGLGGCEGGCEGGCGYCEISLWGVREDVLV